MEEPRMKPEDPLQKEYYTSLSSLGQELFTDFLSDLNRKRQSILLLTSIITILISFALIKPIEASFGGVKVSFLKPQILPVLSGAVCLYFLITYSIGVIQDWEHYQFRQAPAFNNIEGFRSLFEKTEKILPDTLGRRREQIEGVEAEQTEQKIKNNSITEEDLDNYVVARRALNVLESTVKKYNQLNRLKLFFEVAFPIGLAIFAVGSAVWAAYFR